MAEPKHIKMRNPVAGLLTDLINESGQSRTAVAAALNIPMPRLSELASGKRRVTAELALKLGIVWNTTPEYWMNLQTNWDLIQTKQAKAMELAKIQPIPA